MPPTIADQRYANAFATALVSRISARARGTDSPSARFIRQRPADAILCGFLVPAEITRNAQGAVESDDVEVDDPAELSSLGFEWLSPVAALDDPDATIDLTIRYAVYQRVLPTFDEIIADVQLTSRRHDPAKDGNASVPAVIVPEAWKRLYIGPILVTHSLRDVTRGLLAQSLGDALQEKVRLAISSEPDIYPSRQSVVLLKSDLATPEAYSHWKARQRRTSSVGSADWNPVLDIRSSPYPGDATLRRLTVRLANRSSKVGATEAAFADPNIYAVEVTAVIPATCHRFDTFRELDRSYRYDRRLAAIGLNCHVEAEFADQTVRFNTETVPIAQSPRLDPRPIEGVSLRFSEFATDPFPALLGIADAMRQYDGTAWAQKIAELTLARDNAVGPRRDSAVQELLEAERDRAAYLANEVEAFERGIRLLEDARFSDAFAAFQLMNEALGRAAAKRGYDSWRLFQIVFVVRMLPQMVSKFDNRARDYVRDGEADEVEILWFAAGGGKTEAFFGLLVWQLFLDRLTGKTFGTTAFLRFPLRLLTFQQLQRLADTLAQADLLRIERSVPGEEFSIGYFVGGTQTPNSIGNDMDRRYRERGVDMTLRQLSHCPYCGGEDVRLEYDSTNRLIAHKCGGANVCPNPRSTIPLYIVDTDVYRYLPSVIVSTVDKLANIGQNRRFANLFGRVDRRCAKHGAAFLTSNRDICEASAAAQRGERPTVCSDRYNVRYGPFPRLSPSLQIADELHLLRQELGAFDGHYETTAVAMQRSLGQVPWKVIAATATIERFDNHAWQLYTARATRFPGPGPVATESFYYHENRERLGRFFVGMLGVARAHTPSVARIKSLFLQESDDIRRRVANDLQRLCEDYGLPDLSAAEVNNIAFLYEIVLTYVLTLKGSDQVSEAIDNRVRQELSRGSGSGDDLIVKMLNSGIAMPDMIATMNRISDANPDTNFRERIRALITTNIISHGVDVDRFGVIIFAGFPRQIAEYIQASARVGRTWPGISVLVPTPQAERDRSVYDRFKTFHTYIDRLVEPSAINRWPDPVLRRTAPGILCAYLMGVASSAVGREIYTVQHVQSQLGGRGAGALDADTVIDWCLEAIRANLAESVGYRERARQLFTTLYDRVIGRSLINDPAESTNLWDELKPMKSLRDVDDPAEVAIEDSEEQQLFRALTST